MLTSDSKSDPYAVFAEDANDRVVEFLARCDEAAQAFFAAHEDLRQAIATEFSLTPEQAATSPTRTRGIELGGWTYFRDWSGGDPYPRHIRESLQGDRQVVLDENTLVGESGFIAIGDIRVSPHDDLCAFTADRSGAEEWFLGFRDLVSGCFLEGDVSPVARSIAWLVNPDRAIVCVDKSNDTDRAVIYNLDRGSGSRTLVEARTAAAAIDVGLGKYQHHIFIRVTEPTATELFVLDASDEDALPLCLVSADRGVSVSAVDCRGSGRVMLSETDMQTGQSQIVDYRIDGGRVERRALYSSSEVASIEGFDVVEDHVIVAERADARIRITAFPLKDSTDAWTFDAFPSEHLELGRNSNPRARSVRVNRSSLTRPLEFLELEVSTGVVLAADADVPSGYVSNNYTSTRMFARSRDGTQVPMTIAHSKSTRLDGSAPCVLVAYGAYGISFDPEFLPFRQALFDDGFVFAIAHIRGGGENGPAWHRAAMGPLKRRSVEDLIACSEFLSADGYAAPGRIALRGGSAGGVTIGAAMLRRADLFGAIVLHSPLVDLLPVLMDGSLPLSLSDRFEWGDPSNDSERDTIAEFSPFNLTRPMSLPPVYVTVAPEDQRVREWEIRRWVAKLQDCNQADTPILLDRRAIGGHAAAGSRRDRFLDLVRTFVFIYSALDVEPSCLQEFAAI